MNSLRVLVSSKPIFRTWSKASYNHHSKCRLRDDINQILYPIIEEIILLGEEEDLEHD